MRFRFSTVPARSAKLYLLVAFAKIDSRAALRAGLRRKDKGLSFPFAAVETAGYYRSSPAGTQAGVGSAWKEFPDAAWLADKFSGSFHSALLPFGRAASVRMTGGKGHR